VRKPHCKDSNRREAHENISFTFLGYTFRPREALNKRRGVKFTSFQPAMSREKLTEKSREVRRWRLHRRPNDTLADLARAINPFVRGWMAYWGRFYRTEMDALLKRINTYLMRWARKRALPPDLGHALGVYAAVGSVAGVRRVS
jgi:RNA-directed DNA polymerase